MIYDSWEVLSHHGPYRVTVGAGLTKELPDLIPPEIKGRKVALLTHPSLLSLGGEEILMTFGSVGETVLMPIPEGEPSKSLEAAESLYLRLIEAGFHRRDWLVCLGGGVVGDLGGFVAATYLRGIPYFSLPTTLLAQVDSSIGGKVGINLPAGKNLVGAFYPPRAVIADADFLKTLPDREYRSGLAEVVKYGVALDADFFTFLENNEKEILSRNLTVVTKMIGRCAAIKSEVVTADERESGSRMILNFGHTLGHALETMAGFGHLSHGEAVAAGMVFAVNLSVLVAEMDPKEADRVCSLINKFRLLPDYIKAKPNDLINNMKVDKKIVDNYLKFVLTPRIGMGKVYSNLSEKDIVKAIKKTLKGGQDEE